MAKLSLTEAARDDLRAIEIFGIQRFGVLQATVYVDGLLEHFDAVFSMPLAYPSVDYILPRARRSVFKSHAVYFRVDANGGVVIDRIIGRQAL